MKIKYFPTEIGIFQREICHLKVFKRQAFGWLSTGLAKNIKFEILSCLEVLEDCK